VAWTARPAVIGESLLSHFDHCWIGHELSDDWAGEEHAENGGNRHCSVPDHRRHSKREQRNQAEIDNSACRNTQRRPVRQRQGLIAAGDCETSPLEDLSRDKEGAEHSECSGSEGQRCDDCCLRSHYLESAWVCQNCGIHSPSTGFVVEAHLPASKPTSLTVAE
jgi:hypothetical protein